MGKTILVTGKESFLGNEIVRHLLNQGCQVAVHDRPRTAAAAKNLILQTVHKHDSIDEAWLIISPERETYDVTDLPPAALDGGLDAVKNTLYLVRELLARHAVAPLALRFVFFDEDPAGLPPLAAIQYHGLRGLVTSLFPQAKKRGLTVWAYETLVPRADEYVSYILNSKAPASGRWNVLGERRNLVNSLFARKENS